MFGAEKNPAAVRSERLFNGNKSATSAWCRRVSMPQFTDALAVACKTELLALGVEEKNITHVTVPGALEVGTALQVLAEQTGCL